MILDVGLDNVTSSGEVNRFTPHKYYTTYLEKFIELRYAPDSIDYQPDVVHLAPSYQSIFHILNPPFT